MNNAHTIVLRAAGSCLHSAPWPRPSHFLQRLTLTCKKACYPAVPSSCRVASIPRPGGSCPIEVAFGLRPFSTSKLSSFRQSVIAQKLQAYVPEKNADQEQGLALPNGDFAGDGLRTVFGDAIPPPRFANRLLRVLHGRRVDGTLDLPLPADMKQQLRRYPQAFDDGLQWLRQAHPMDEDAAILARIEREEAAQEQENPSELIQQAEDIKLYAPQSGRYKAELSEQEGDVFGRSELDKIRERNIAEAEREEEELQAQINRIQGEVKEAQTKALAARPESGIEAVQEVRPPNEFEKWKLRARNRAQSKLTLESAEVVNQTLSGRLLPSFLFVALVCVVSYFYAQFWVPPKRSDRIFPDVSLSFATVGALVAVNVGILALWYFPPMWKLFNRYLVVTPGKPTPLSMLGNIFSHQSPKHLLFNMAGLLVFGLSLHEDVGRGTFLAIYLASGACGSFFSLSSFAIRRLLYTSSLGASGSIWGVVAAYCWIHAE